MSAIKERTAVIGCVLWLTVSRHALLSCSVWTDKLHVSRILVIRVRQNGWLNITIGLFRDASGFVHLRCGEQTLMEVILTNIKLIPDKLAQLFVLPVRRTLCKTSESCGCGSCLFACICHCRWTALSFLCLIWTWRLLYRRTDPSVKEFLLCMKSRHIFLF